MNEEQAKTQREWDEAITMMIDQYPKLWFGLYSDCIKEGFNAGQALELVKAFIAKPL